MIAKTLRSTIAVATFGAAALVTTGAQAAPGNYCPYVDGTVYCANEKFIYENDPRLGACLHRWEIGVMACPPEVE